jgi:ribosome-binding factor A
MDAAAKGLYPPPMSKSGSGAPSQRQLRVGELVRHALSTVLLKGDVHDPELNRHSITVSEVVLSPDLRIATAYVLPLGGKDREAALLALRENRVELRRLVTKGLTLKFSPELRFEIDTSFDKMDEARRLFADEKVQKDVKG